ncbi:hypothetical protein IWW38_006385, partial [Coemansia aciculifera]
QRGRHPSRRSSQGAQPRDHTVYHCLKDVYDARDSHQRAVGQGVVPDHGQRCKYLRFPRYCNTCVL